jgi:2-haloacid dehalogenase
MSDRAVRLGVKPLVFAASLAPLAWLVWAALSGRLSANPLSDITNGTGIWTVRFVCLTLAITPLRWITGWNRLVKFRRMTGLYAFFYGTLHFLTYVVVDRFAGLDFPNGIVSSTTALALAKSVGEDVYKRPFITIGFTAWLMMLPLAITSTAGWIRRLGGRNWNRLHKLVYATGALAVLHYWWLVRSDVRRPVAYATVVLVLLAFRAQKLRVNRVKRAAIAFGLFFAVAATAHAAPADPHPIDVAVAAPSIVSDALVNANERAAVRGSFGAPRFRAVAFDSFVLFNPDSIVATAESIFPGHGRELTTSWRTRQFEYSWLRSITDRYTDFFNVTVDALVYACHALGLELTPDNKRRLLDAYLHLMPWPDTVDALRRLRAAGVRVIAITNFSPAMLRSNATNAAIANLFDRLVSTDMNHTFKPDPRAYQLGPNVLHLPAEDIVFAAFGGWDAAGAKAFGYPTVWVNRFNQPIEELGVRPDRIATDLDGLLRFVLEETYGR